jgi:hypothetical protein
MIASMGCHRNALSLRARESSLALGTLWVLGTRTRVILRVRKVGGGGLEMPRKGGNGSPNASSLPRNLM